jgi:Ca2+-binding EF-hand superfamily protein
MAMSALSGMMGGQMPNLSAMRDKLFQKADANGDKGISLDELMKAGQNMPGGNGGISETKASELFGKLDSDKNGSLSEDEVATFFDKLSSDMRGAMVDLQAKMDGAGGKPDPMAMFGEADQDGNGAISRSEFNQKKPDGPGLLSALFGKDEGNDAFAKIDADKDGSVSREEFDAFGEKMLEKMQSMMTGGSSSADLMQAMNAYGTGSGDARSDLTSKFLNMLKSSNSEDNRKREWTA